MDDTKTKELSGPRLSSFLFYITSNIYPYLIFILLIILLLTHQLQTKILNFKSSLSSNKMEVFHINQHLATQNIPPLNELLYTDCDQLFSYLAFYYIVVQLFLLP